MKIPKAWLAVWLALISTSMATSSQKAAGASPKPLEKDIAVLIQNLSDENYVVREQASSELWRLGETALSALKEAADSDDPEQAIRARDLLRKIQLHITPETDPSIITLVENYARSSANEKIRLIGQMRGKRAWHQILKIYATETSGEVRERLQKMVETIAVRAARERLMENDAAGAREFLELAPASNQSLIALAEFHRTHGTLKDELKQAAALQGPKGARWRLALSRANGDIAAARREALAADEPTIAAVMAAFAGNPQPWLQAITSDPDQSKVKRAYAAAAIKLWQGGEVHRQELEILMTALESRDSTRQAAAMSALFLLGELKAAEPELEELSPVAAFQYYEVQERIPEALRVLGLDPEKPDYKEWVAKRLKRITGDDIEDQHEASEIPDELAAIAAFLEKQGLHEEAWNAFSEPLAAIAEEDAGAVADFLALLFGSNREPVRAPDLAKRLGLAWAGEDERKWDELLVVSFGDNEQIRNWWRWLEEIAPEASRNERYDAMLALLGMGTDPQRLRTKWLARAWDTVEKLPAPRRPPMVDLLESICRVVPDVGNSLKIWDIRSRAPRNTTYWGAIILPLAAADRWDEVAHVFLEQIEKIAGSFQEPRADYHAYVAAALRLAGRADEAAIHDELASKLALGEPGMCAAIGKAYAYGRDYQRAAAWWRRAAIECDPESDDWSVVVSHHSDELLEQRNWSELAAIAELIACNSIDSTESNPLGLLHHRLKIDTAWALANLSSHRAIALKRLERNHHMLPTHGVWADYFFPALREMGLMQQHDAWFDQTWDAMKEILRRYPDSDNAMNTTAWFAGRARRNLHEAEAYVSKALRKHPNEAPYLDTMAEIQFAMGNRKQAIQWSDKAVNFAPADFPNHLLFCRQRERFRSDSLPK